MQDSRLKCIKEAYQYLGVGKNLFNTKIRPRLPEIRLGKRQGVRFDLLDLNAWIEDHKHRNGRPVTNRSNSLWDKIEYPDSMTKMGSGVLISKSKVDAFERALVQATSRKPSSI